MGLSYGSETAPGLYFYLWYVEVYTTVPVPYLVLCFSRSLIQYLVCFYYSDLLGWVRFKLLDVGSYYEKKKQRWFLFIKQLWWILRRRWYNQVLWRWWHDRRCFNTWTFSSSRTFTNWWVIVRNLKPLNWYRYFQVLCIVSFIACWIGFCLSIYTGLCKPLTQVKLVEKNSNSDCNFRTIMVKWI